MLCRYLGFTGMMIFINKYRNKYHTIIPKRRCFKICIILKLCTDWRRACCWRSSIGSRFRDGPNRSLSRREHVSLFSFVSVFTTAVMSISVCVLKVASSERFLKRKGGSVTLNYSFRFRPEFCFLSSGLLVRKVPLSSSGSGTRATKFSACQLCAIAGCRYCSQWYCQPQQTVLLLLHLLHLQAVHLSMELLLQLLFGTYLCKTSAPRSSASVLGVNM